MASRVSSFKGGTLVVEHVRDLEAHQRRICDPDGYRPARCPRCGHDVLHVHCYPERHPRGEPGTPPVVRVAQYICAADECNATWRMLPMFLARHLWRVWKTVERVALPGQPPPTTRSVPERTRSRWRVRLAAAARVLVVLLAASGGLALERIAARVGLDASRARLVVAYAELADVAPDTQLAAVAALAHRLERGIRLM